MTDLAQLYQATILDHHKRPRGSGRLVEPTHSAEGHNPLCGDRLTITARVAEGQLEAVRCDASGCAICRASGSLLTESVAGRALVEIQPWLDALLARLSGAAASPGQGLAELDSGDLAALLQVRHFPGRQRCATLAWETLRRALFDR